MKGFVLSWSIVSLGFLSAGCPGAEDVTLAPPAQGYQFAPEPFAVPKGTETQRCFFYEIPSDTPVWVNRFEMAQNVGSHHLNIFRVRTIQSLSGNPGDVVVDGQCWISSNWADWPLVVNSQAANPNSPTKTGYYDEHMPAGVAMQFQPHELIMIQSHYVNATTQTTPLRGKVIVNFDSVDASTVQQEMGTLFATDQNIRICPGDTNKSFTSTCQIAASVPVTIFAANSHFHSRGVDFTISTFDPATGSTSSPFYESQNWNEPPMATGLSVQVPANGGVSYTCTFTCAPGLCGDPNNGCCFTFGGHVETQEHCNIFVYYYPKTRDVGCF